MEKINYIELEKIIENIDEVYAHRKELDGEIIYESLLEHSETVKKNLKMLIEKKNLNIVIDNLGKKFFENKADIVLWKNLLFNGIYLHDLGKININFQAEKMKNLKSKLSNDIPTSNHSLFSAYLYIETMLENFFPGDDVEDIEDEMLYFLVLNAYIISKHHGSLDSFCEFVEGSLGNVDEEKISKLLFNFKGMVQIEDIEDDLTLESVGSMEHYIYAKLLFSMLVVSDIYGTKEYMEDKEVGDIGVLKKEDSLFEKIRDPESGSVFCNIKKYKDFLGGKGCNPFDKNSINILRSEMFLEAEKNLLEGIKNNIFYLEAPTGSGKTITSLNLAYRITDEIEEINKIFYIFPFNTLVEQTKDSIEDVLGKDIIEGKMGVINSLTPLEVEEDKGEVPDYDKGVTDREFIHYPLVLTSHVNFFKYLFGVNKKDNYPLLHLANSVVIMDEIQSYKNKIWREIIQFLHKYGELLNIKIIIMSATLPKLSYLASNERYKHLIEDRDKYFKAPIFKDRVQLDFSLLDLDKEEIFSKLMEKIKEYPKDMILIEFLSKKKAFEFYTLVKECCIKSELLTGDDSRGERKRIIDKTKKLEKVPKDKREEGMVLISTQVIEAGVDIDMDIGFKDISLFDSEEQFMGRVNRSCKKTGKVYFFDLTSAQRIYKEDERRNNSLTLACEENRELLKKKDFQGYYTKVMERLELRNEFLEDLLEDLDFKKISKEMKLINEQNKYQIFINREIEVEKNGCKIRLNGLDVWNEFLDILKINKNNYSERKVRLSQVMEKMNEFIYELYNMPGNYADEKAGIFFIEDGEDYFTEGKLDRERLEIKKEFDFIV
ncbi:CRISPR-associated helicase Cas3' (plasmid) [Fusobacteria bacterium ZRK30]|nr:CRISPR-associated helicase Cas3' [Fusobacteria bacterium ZRK30]